MLWITKYRHNKIVEEYQKAINDLKETLNRKEKFEEILDRITDKDKSPFAFADGSCVSGMDIMHHLDETVPRYTDDY